MEFAEVQYYLRLTRENTIAIVSMYSRPDPILLKASHHTLWSCSYQGNASLKVISTEAIVGVVAMVPLFGVQDRYFVVEKPGLDIAHMRGDDETIVDED